MAIDLSRRSFAKAAAASAAAVALVPGLALADEAESADAAEEEASAADADAAETADVVVCGCGAAGLQAALTLQAAGVSTILLEKGASCGVANGALAGGPALADTTVQAAEDATVTVETLFNHEYEYSHGTVNAALLHRVTEVGQAVVDNFMDNGVNMGLRIDAYGMGFRARHNFADADGNQVSGVSRFQPLVDKFVADGGVFETNRAAYELVQDADGKVTGVRARDMEDDSTVEYTCKAVLVATGGYAGNDEMLREHFGDIEIWPLCNTLSVGEGYDMILAAGGVADRNWGLCCNEFGGANSKIDNVAGSAMAFASSAQKFAIYGGLIVDPNGDRFMNEQWLSDRPLAQGGEMSLRVAKYYAVADQAMVDSVSTEGILEYYGNPEDWYVGQTGLTDVVLDALPEDIETAIEQDWCFKGTLAEAAEHFGLTNLEATVAEYNEMAAAGEDTLFYKSSYLMKEMSGDTYYVFEYQPSIWTTFGGVKSDAYSRCVTPQQEVIPGLYVAGVDNGSLYTNPYYDNEGASLGIAYGNGIVAAQTIISDLETL